MENNSYIQTSASFINDQLAIGNAGNVILDAKQIYLSEGSNIIADTSGPGSGGDIIIGSKKSTDTIILRGNSSISNNAKGGTGGNIKINTGVIVGLENSDITANSSEASGGRIEITSKGIFGLIPRTRDELQRLLDTDNPDKLDPGELLSSDITAISQSSPTLNGEVILNTPEVDPSKDLVEAPTSVVDPNTLVSNNPCRRSSDSSFINSGRGGLPPSLSEDLASDASQVSLVEPALVSSDSLQPKTIEPKTTSLTPDSSTLAPAQGWVFNDKGEVVLVAYNPAVEGPQRLQANPAGCPAK